MAPLIDLSRNISVDHSGTAAGEFRQKLGRGGMGSSTVRGLLDALPNLLKELLSEPNKQIEDRIHDLSAAKAKHEGRTVDNFRCQGAITDAMSGNIALVLSGAAAVNVAAADLNAAAAGTFKRGVGACFKNAKGEAHRWARFAPLVTPTKTVVDTDVVAPTIEGTPKFKDGAVLAMAVFDTDAGATKTYAVGDSVAVKIQTNAADSLLGYSLATGGVTKTFNVV